MNPGSGPLKNRRDLSKETRPPQTLFDLFSEYIGYRGEYTTLNFILNNYNHNPPGNLKSLDNNILKDIANLQWNMNAAQDAQQALGAALRRYLDYFGNAANVKAAKFYGQDVYDRFKTYTNYFFDKENMRGSHVPRPTTPDHD